jgi:hypothetical protein
VQITQRLQQVEEYLVGLPKPPTGIFFLILYQSTDRAFAVVCPEPTTASLTLTLSAADLETVAKLEPGDQLSLWKYAQAHWKIRERTRILSASVLDEFFLFVKRDHSYYLSDERLPTVVAVGPGGAGELRREALNKLDIHAAPSYMEGRMLQVWSVYTGSGIPIYFPKPLPEKRESFLVEGYPLTVWILERFSNQFSS